MIYYLNLRVKDAIEQQRVRIINSNFREVYENYIF